MPWETRGEKGKGGRVWETAYTAGPRPRQEESSVRFAATQAFCSLPMGQSSLHARVGEKRQDIVY